MIRREETLRLSKIAVTGLCATASCFALLAHPAAAQDYTYGGDARSFAMGGAGIALMQARSGRSNPATLAFENKEADPTFPALGVRATGPVSRDSASGYLTGGFKAKDALSLSRTYGSRDSEFGLNAMAGFRFGHVELGAYAVGTGRVLPNSSLQTWVRNTPREYGLMPQDSRADVYAAGYYNLPSIAYGRSFSLGGRKDGQTKRSLLAPNNTPELGVGLRLKAMRAVYSHYVADYASLQGVADAQLAPEMNGNDTLTKNGFGADLGFLIRPHSGSGVSGALVVANAVKPNFVFNSTDRNGNSSRVDLLRTTFTAGVGYEALRGGTTLAADLVDFTGAAGPAQLRFGAEQRVWRSLALRAGYSGSAGLTYGLNFFGVDAAFGTKMPLEVVRTFRF